jgi:hypothetical protein
MKTNSSWSSTQALIILALIALIFAYITIDVTLIKPQISRDVKDVRKKYIELSTFLNKKMPQIDSTFKIQTSQLKQQKAALDTLKTTFDNLK